jgi:small subunit ribosomal protein S6
MVRDYELMYIARPDLDEEGLQGAVESVEQLINGAGGSVVITTSWGRRRLAYEVDHLRDGHYMLLHARLEGGRVAEVERALAIHETVFRHLLVLREGGDDSEPEDIEGASPATRGAAAAENGERPAAARQAVVAAAPDDDDDEEDDEDGEPAAVLADDDEEDDEDGEPAAVLADDEEEN